MLVTDDNAGLRETLTEILSNEGYAVETAPNGRVAMAVLESRPVDVLLLDLAMPLMDGMALLHEIDPPPPVVIVYSAFAYYNPDEVRRQVGAKVFRLLRKPLPPSQLVAAIGEAIAELGSE